MYVIRKGQAEAMEMFANKPVCCPLDFLSSLRALQNENYVAEDAVGAGVVGSGTFVGG